MNEICSDLMQKLNRRHPEIDDQIFLELILAMLDAWKEGCDLNQLSQDSADKMWLILEPLTRDNIEKWLIGVMAQKGGEFQTLLREPMFEGMA